MIFIIFGCIFAALVKARSVCYEPYGCFDSTSLFEKLPQSPKVVDTKYNLYRRDNMESPQLISPLDTATIAESDFDASNKTVVIAHGWTESGSEPWIRRMVNALLERDEMNVIITDWSGGSQQLYHQSVGNCRLVGKQIAYLIDKLSSEFGLKFSDVHLIGYSLGAQIAGFAGRNLQKDSRKVARITGLDPAAPKFEGNDPDDRLDESDAEFVDIIHTSSKKILIGRIGVKEKTGHLDFFPNGGELQPGCHSISDVFEEGFVSCSHFRAPEYFIESINSQCPFTAYPCDNYENFEKGHCTKCPTSGCPKMGYDAEKHLETGKKFYLVTSSQSPFCVYQYKISFKTGTKFLGRNILGVVKVQMHGSTANSTEITLPRRNYLKDSTESFVVGTAQKLGAIEDIKIVKKFARTWYLEHVVVQEFESGERYKIPFNEYVK